MNGRIVIFIFIAQMEFRFQARGQFDLCSSQILLQSSRIIEAMWAICAYLKGINCCPCRIMCDLLSSHFNGEAKCVCVPTLRYI